MKEFKQYITELRTKPADSNAKHDSDHDLVDVSDETVVRRLNAFLGVISHDKDVYHYELFDKSVNGEKFK